MNFDDLVNKAVARAENRYDIAAVSSYERTALPPIPEPFTILYRFLKRKFNEWKLRERERRMDPVYKHYQHKLLKMEEQLTKEYIDELREVSMFVYFSQFCSSTLYTLPSSYGYLPFLDQPGANG